ncbi:Protamine and protamine like [Popillia japonica]|uniref:Protamine and protamine like n=1 Tax=Popillia japonica TaxID=7064 RepID=A0AAW1IXE2_POPJA
MMAKSTSESRAERCKKYTSKSGSASSREGFCAKFLGRSSDGQKGGKCHKPGPVTRNPFLNFLRDYRKKHCGKTVVQIARDGAKEWRCMSEQQKEQYIKSACLAPKKARKSRRRSRTRVRRSKRGSSGKSICSS